MVDCLSCAHTNGVLYAGVTDADSGTVHQAGIADRHHGSGAAGKGERAQPPDDGHGSRVPCCLGIISGR